VIQSDWRQKVVAINYYFWQSNTVYRFRFIVYRPSPEITTLITISADQLNHKHILLEQKKVLATRKKKTNPARKTKVTRLTKRSKIINTIIGAIKKKKGENIISLDLRKINEAVADFFIVCEASNQPQVRAITDFVKQEVKEKCHEIPYHHEGKQKLSWVLIDYVNVVVHVMLSDTRKFYRLEEMWSDATVEEHKD